MKDTINEKALVYFGFYKKEDKLENWSCFDVNMNLLGFEMDCEKSFAEYKKQSKLKVKPAASEREEKRNNLYYLEHADRQIVGNYLFSHWHYLTHWAYSYDKYDVDYLLRIMDILVSKYDK